MFKQPRAAPVNILEYRDAPRVRLPWDSRFSVSALRDHLDQYPRLAFWNRVTGEYAVGGHWRGRRDIGLVLETSKGSSRDALIDRLVSRFREDGLRAVVISQDEVQSFGTWYRTRGWAILDRLLAFRLALSPVEYDGANLLSISRFQHQDLDVLTELDRVAFPWLWWNEPSDFLAYVSSANVAAYLARHDGRLVGYVSYSARNDRGYLDRLAIHPSLSRRGHGSRLLVFALRRMRQVGVREVGLTTQEANTAAQELYRHFGFTRTGEGHEILGKELP